MKPSTRTIEISALDDLIIIAASYQGLNNRNCFEAQSNVRRSKVFLCRAVW